MWKGQDTHWGFAGVCQLPVYVCEGACMSVLADGRVAVMRVLVFAFWKPCDIPHGKQKDNVRVKRGARGKKRRERMEKEESQESWVWISLKCSIWWVIIFTKAAKSILFPKGVAPTHSSFLPVLSHSFIPECQCLSFVCFSDDFSALGAQGMSMIFYDLPQTFQCIPHK